MKKVLLAIGAAALLAVPVVGQIRQDQPAATGQTLTISGRIVDLHQHMTAETGVFAAPADPQERQQRQQQQQQQQQQRLGQQPLGQQPLGQQQAQHKIYALDSAVGLIILNEDPGMAVRPLGQPAQPARPAEPGLRPADPAQPAQPGAAAPGRFEDDLALDRDGDIHLEHQVRIGREGEVLGVPREKKLADSLGQDVQVQGRFYERDGLRYLVVKQIERQAEAQLQPGQQR